MSIAPDQVRYEPFDYVGFLRRRGWIVVLVGILGLLGGYQLLGAQEKTFSSTASVLVVAMRTDAGEVANGRTSGAVNLDTEAQLVKSEAMAVEVAKKLDKPGEAEAAGEDVSVTVPANTSVLNISFEGSTPDDARDGAQAFADTYLAQRQAAANAISARQTKALQTQISSTTGQLKTVTGRIAVLPTTSPDRQLATAQQSVLVSQLTQLNARLSNIQGDDSTAGRVITKAPLPSSPTDPVPLLFLASGLMVGLLGGFVLAFALHRADRRVRRGADLVAVTGHAPLTTTPKVPSAVLAQSGSALGEAFGSLAHALEVQLPGGGAVAVTGASSGPATSFAAANLAVALERHGNKVGLLALDADSPVLDELLGAVNSPLIGDIVQGGSALDEAAVREGITVIPAGRSLTEQAVRGLKPIARVVQKMLDQHDYVVVSTPSTSSSAQAQGVASVTDGTLLVAQRGRTKREDVSDALSQFERVGATVLGSVLIDVGRSLIPGRSAAEPAQPAAARHERPKTSGVTATPTLSPAESDDQVEHKGDEQGSTDVAHDGADHRPEAASSSTRLR